MTPDQGLGTAKCHAKPPLLAILDNASRGEVKERNRSAFQGTKKAREAGELRSGYALTPSPRSRKPERRRGLSALKRRKKKDSDNHPLSAGKNSRRPVKNNCR